MAKITANYEAMYILDPALSEEAIAALVAKFKAVVEAVWRIPSTTWPRATTS